MVVDGAILASNYATRKKKVVTGFICCDIGELEGASFHECAVLRNMMLRIVLGRSAETLSGLFVAWGRLDRGAPSTRAALYASLNQMMVEAAGVEPFIHMKTSKLYVFEGPK